MIQDIKVKMLEEPSSICDLLEIYDFAHIKNRGSEIRFGRDEYAGANNISIKLINNEWLNVTDWSRGKRADIFSYIAQEKNVKFREVLKTTKDILGLDDTWRPKARPKLFGGIYEHLINRNHTFNLKTYDEDILNQYQPYGSLRWLSEGLTLEAQHFYDVCFDVVSNRICFPWRDQHGSIIAIKGRINEDETPEDVPKYFYLIPNDISNSLFNYSQCYEYLYGADRVFVFESEKSCIKAWSWGIKNTVAIGHHTLSQEQIKLLLQLQCKEICLMLDSDLPLSKTKKNAEAIKEFARMRDIKLTYWNWTYNLDLDSKSAPVDGTLEQFKYILDNEIESIEKLQEEECENNG